jgi:DNA-binding response OmpR family regulator
MKNKILIVDDEESICEILQFNLSNENYEVFVANSAEEAQKFDLKTFDLLLLDVMMEGISGIKFAKHLRSQAETENIPIIFITAKDTENDLLTGFSVGADDYIPKPFSIQVVLARVKSILKRIDKQKKSTENSNLNNIIYNDLQIFVEEKRVLINEQIIDLTKKEYELLLLLLSKKNKIFTREEILSKIWYEDVIVMDRTIDVNIARLRKKMLQYGKNIVTRVGYGYVFED